MKVSGIEEAKVVIYLKWEEITGMDARRCLAMPSGRASGGEDGGTAWMQGVPCNTEREGDWRAGMTTGSGGGVKKRAGC